MAGVATASLATSTFSASGTIGGTPSTVATDGNAFGLHRVGLVALGFHPQFGFAPHVAAGFVIGPLWQTVQLGGGITAQQFAGSLSGIAFGPELCTFWRIRWIDVRGSVAFGDRTLWIPSLALDRVACGGRKYPWAACNPNASSSDFFVGPRLTIGIRPLPALAFGAYVGGDVMPSGGWTSGAYVAASTPAW